MPSSGSKVEAAKNFGVELTLTLESLRLRWKRGPLGPRNFQKINVILSEREGAARTERESKDPESRSRPRRPEAFSLKIICMFDKAARAASEHSPALSNRQKN